MLKFPNSWRFQPPEDGRLLNKAFPPEAASEMLALATKVATQGVDRWANLEHFKRFFRVSCGSTGAEELAKTASAARVFPE